jgi:hypothetical protein
VQAPGEFQNGVNGPDAVQVVAWVHREGSAQTVHQRNPKSKQTHAKLRTAPKVH